MLINASGGSMVWPFLTIYMRQQLDVPLTSVTLLLTARSVAGLVATSFVGPAVDRFGRKRAMILGMAVNGAAFLFMLRADTLTMWLVLMIITGTFSPLVRVSINAMVADLVDLDRRTDAYALLRMIQNLGIARLTEEGDDLCRHARADAVDLYIRNDRPVGYVKRVITVDRDLLAFMRQLNMIVMHGMLGFGK